MENKRVKFGNLPSYLLLFIILIAASCKPSKVVTDIKETVRIDTVHNERVIIKYNAVHDTLTIDNPCDSAGILTTFYSKITLPQGKVIIRSYRGKIQATVNVDSIRSVYESKYRNKEASNVTNSTKIVTKVTYPSWLVTAFIFESLIILGFLYFKYIFGK
jgi:hypothetical protein